MTEAANRTRARVPGWRPRPATPASRWRTSSGSSRASRCTSTRPAGRPSGFDLGGAPYLTRLPRQADLILTFCTDRGRLDKRLPTLIEHTVANGMVWVCWPKRASGVPTDLTEKVVRDTGLAAGVVDVKVAAIDDTWSGLKFVRRLEDR